MKKPEEYALKILSQINQMFEEDSDNYIDKEELFEEGKNLTDFIHALANIAPTFFFNRVTGDRKNFLQFNHLANQLVMQYGQVVENEAE